MKRSKKYLEALSKFDRMQVYDPQEALGLVKNMASAKFNETVEAHIRTGCDGRHADQQIRGWPCRCPGRWHQSYRPR